MPVLGGRLLAALSLAVFAANAGAQQKSCDIDEGSPNQVARAKLDLGLAQPQVAQPGDSAKLQKEVVPKLQEAIKFLSEGDLKKNPTGRAFVLGETLTMWSMLPGMRLGMSTRGALGFPTDPAAPYDIFAGIDSAFTVVETAMPECVGQTGQWRQQKPWVDLVNHAMELANGNQLDSAVLLAKRSLVLSKNAPYGYIVLAQSVQKDNPKDAIALYKQAIAAAKDTNQADTRRQLIGQLGNFAADLADATQNTADKAAYLAEAKSAFEMLAKDPGAKYADAARQGIARVAAASGDTTAIKASYAEQLANPSAFSYAQLMGAAVTAARTNQHRDAIKLFEAARGVNPYHRDVLFNLGRLYILDSLFSQAVPVIRQLIAVDPSNSANYQLMAFAYAGLHKKYDVIDKDYEAKSAAYGKRANAPGARAAVVKASIDSAARLAPTIKAYQDSVKTTIDSTIKYNNLYQDAPVNLTFSDFTVTDAKTTIGGTVSNQTDAAKTYTLKIDFLDKSGNVVTSQTVTVGPVQGKQSASWKAEGTGAGIVAFRYAPLS